MPVVFVESIERDHPRAQAARDRAVGGLTRRRPERQRRLDRRARAADLVRQPVEGDRRRRHRVADHHPADRHEVARLRLEHAEREDQPERGDRRDGESERDRPDSVRHFLRPAARGDRAEARPSPASRAATSSRLSESKIAWITYPTAVSWTNERSTATARSCSRSARRQRDTATAIATSTSDAATSVGVTSIVLTRPPAPRAARPPSDATLTRLPAVVGHEHHRDARLARARSASARRRRAPPHPARRSARRAGGPRARARARARA